MSLTDLPLAVLFVRDMGNYGQNSLSVEEVFQELRSQSKRVRFIGYHRRRSGNFLFEESGEDSLEAARVVAEKVTRLPCLIRHFQDLDRIAKAIPRACVTTTKGSVVFKTNQGPRKVIWVGISKPIAEVSQFTGALTHRVSIIGWPTVQDVLCLYDRQASGGDVGQVTGAVVKALQRRGIGDNVIATGRAVSVIKDLLDGKWVRGE